MEVKQMREQLKDVVDTVPRSNDAVAAMYKEKVLGEAPEKPLTIVPSENEYTYVGSGETPPHMIKFMGIQVFSRGQLTKVTNPEVLAKIKNNQSFVKGAVSQDDLYDADMKAKEKADLQREEDVKTQIHFDRQNSKA